MSDDPRKDLTFDALRNAIYHSARQGFLDTLNRMLSFFVVVSGTAAVGDLGAFLEWPGLTPKLLAACAAFAGALQLVFDFGGKARTHQFLQRRFYEILARLENDLPPAALSELKSQLLLLYAEEPPPMRALDAIAYNAACDSLGRGQRIPITVWQSIFRQVWPFASTDFRSA